MVGRRTRNKKSVYKKRISECEADDKKLLILKSQLKKFPTPGTLFTVQFHTKKIDTMISSESCECRGPDNPHVHYFLSLEGLWDEANLKQGLIVQLQSHKRGEYRLHPQPHL